MDEKKEKSVNLHAGHRQRLRERFVEQGVEGFHPHELLELLLSYAIPQKDTNELAHRLLDHFGGRLPQVLEADVYQLCEVKGISYHTAVLISMLLPTLRLYQKELQREMPVLTNFDAAKKFVKSQYLGITQETFLLICMDIRGRVIAVRFLATGSKIAVSVPSRRLAEEVLRFGAVRVIFAHNHPGGTSMPSSEDVMFTVTMQRFLKHLDVTLDDHIIVGDAEEDVISLKKEGFVGEAFQVGPMQDMPEYQTGSAEEERPV